MGSLHLLLNNDNLDIPKMKAFLEYDFSSINDENDSGETPLIRVLKSENCSEDVVELFLNYGANPNSKDKLGTSALMIAIIYRKDANILRVLLHMGADVSRSNNFHVFYQNSLSQYLYHYNDKCSVEIVKHFIQCGINVNRLNNLGQTVLVTALCCCNDKEIIRALLVGGADPNMHDGLGRFPLCRALCSNHPVDVIKMLLNAGACLNRCMVHESVLHCATYRPYSGLNEDVLQLLLEEGADVRRVNRSGESLLCFAIPRTERAGDIKLLLKAGASLICSMHSSPMLCATTVEGALLNEEKVKVLVDEGACADVENNEGLSPLVLALKNCSYETEAIRMLFNLQTVEKCARWNKNILHFALSNSLCKISVLRFLIDNGAQLDQVNSSGDFLMHVAVAVDFRLDFKSSIIQFLLKLGTPVNVENASGETPLELALENRTNLTILQMLLAAGARVNNPLLHIWQKSAKYGKLLWRYSLEGLNLILKYTFLQNPNFEVRDLIQGHIHYEALLNFAAKCLSEVRRMESKTIGDGRSFREFLNELYLPREIADDHNLQVNDFNQLLKILITDGFPLFIDIILTKIGRKKMKIKLQELQVYAVKCSANVKVILDYDSLCKIAKFLSDEELLRLILAFYDTNDK